MSQTTGQGGNDPEKDEWLRQFKGLPEDFEPDDLKNDRPYVDHVMRKRGDGITFEGQMDSMGDAASHVAEEWDNKGESHRRARRIAGWVALAFLAITILGSLVRDFTSI